MLRRILILLLVVVALPLWSAKMGMEDVEKLMSLSDSSLMSLAKKKLSMKGHEYDALTCYLIVTRRYKQSANENDARQAAHAYMDLGYMFSTVFCDYARAQSNLQRSLDISQARGYSGIVAYCYLDLACIRMMYASSVELVRYDPETISLLQKSINIAISIHHTDLMVYNFINLSSVAIENEKPCITAPYAELFLRGDKLRLPHHSQYVRLLALAMDSYDRGRYAEAVELFGKMVRATTDSEYVSRIRLIFLARLLRAITLERHGTDVQGTARELNELAVFARQNGIDDGLCDVYRHLTSLYRKHGDKAKAAEAEVLFLQTQQSFVKRSNLVNAGRMAYEQHISKIYARLTSAMQQKQTMQRILIYSAVTLAMCVLFLLVLIHYNKKQRRYITLLYEKNMLLVKREEKLRMERTQQQAACRTRKLPDGNGPKPSEREVLKCKIQEVLDDVDTVCQLKFSLQQLAELTNSNTSYVSKTLKEMTGESFKMVISQIRIKEACLRLADNEHYGHLTIDAIGESVGFKSRGHFSVVFKKTTGLSASEFRQSALQKG